MLGTFARDLSAEAYTAYEEAAVGKLKRKSRYFDGRVEAGVIMPQEVLPAA